MVQIDMKMPEKCEDCRFYGQNKFCLATSGEWGNKVEADRPKWCPLIDLDPPTEEEETSPPVSTDEELEELERQVDAL